MFRTSCTIEVKKIGEGETRHENLKSLRVPLTKKIQAEAPTGDEKSFGGSSGIHTVRGH